MIDGTIARRMHTESKTGAILDSIADCCFLLAVSVKLLPVIIRSNSSWILCAIVLIAIIKICGYIVGIIKFHRFTALHTIANKITGMVLFCVPYFILRTNTNLLGIIVCMIAGLSAIEELLIGIKSKSFNPNVKSIFKM